MQTVMKSAKTLAQLVLALGTVTAAAGCVGRQAIGYQAEPQQAASSALAAVPLDSLCAAAATRCLVLAIDTTVRATPYVGPHSPTDLPVAFYLPARSLAGLGRPGRHVTAVTFDYHRIERDTVSVWLMQTPTTDDATAVIGVAVLLPGQWGSVVRLELVRHRGRWVVRRVDLHES